LSVQPSRSEAVWRLGSPACRAGLNAAAGKFGIAFVVVLAGFVCWGCDSDGEDGAMCRILACDLVCDVEREWCLFTDVIGKSCSENTRCFPLPEACLSADRCECVLSADLQSICTDWGERGVIVDSIVP
jgi:hypothetical protein